MSAPADRSTGLVPRVAAVWFLGLIVLATAGWAGGVLAAAYDLGPTMRHWVQAVIMSGLVVPGVWLMRRHVDRRPFAGLEMLGFARSVKGFALGAGLILVPAAITLLSTELFGWAAVSINLAPSSLMVAGLAVLTAFFYEALPEELLFRGYIFRNLHTVMRQWTASLSTIALFVMLPIFLVPLQRHLFQMETQLGASDGVTVGYLVMLVLFAAFLQYLRVLTGTVWTGIGFHLFFLMAGRGLVGTTPTSFIELSELKAQTPPQIVLLGSLLICFVGLLLYPRLTGRSLGWGETNPE
jgi:uncharacterized protein